MTNIFFYRRQNTKHCYFLFFYNSLFLSKRVNYINAYDSILHMAASSKKRGSTPVYIELKGFLSFFILHELSHGELSGDELALRIGKRKGSILTPGTIYPALKRLKKKKLLFYRREGRKKYYSLTIIGKKELMRLYKIFGACFSGLKSKIRR